MYSSKSHQIENWGKTMFKQLLIGFLFSLTLISAVGAQTDNFIHVRLVDPLDRPEDGYCFDILGTGRNLRLDLPLFAHNCKDGATPDSTVVYTPRGQLIFPAAGVCVTAFGVNNTVLPGTSVLLRPCDERSAFFETTELQKFDHTQNGQLKLRGYELCLAVGPDSSRTYSPLDRWRVLSLESCDEVDQKFSAWEFVLLN